MKSSFVNVPHKKWMALIGIIVSIALVLSTGTQSEAVSYIGHDGSIDTHLKKIKVAPYANKKDTWIYIVSACGLIEITRV